MLCKFLMICIIQTFDSSVHLLQKRSAVAWLTWKCKVSTFNLRKLSSAKQSKSKWHRAKIEEGTKNIPTVADIIDKGHLCCMPEMRLCCVELRLCYIELCYGNAMNCVKQLCCMEVRVCCVEVSVQIIQTRSFSMQWQCCLLAACQHKRFWEIRVLTFKTCLFTIARANKHCFLKIVQTTKHTDGGGVNSFMTPRKV
jgi:hypothetical protein